VQARRLGMASATSVGAPETAFEQGAREHEAQPGELLGDAPCFSVLAGWGGAPTA
jgi:hypothetical protein